MIRRQNHGTSRQHLQNHFHFAQRRRRNHQSFHRGNFAQPHHHEFASDDDHHHPRLHQSHLHQRNKRGGNQQLVRNGIQQNSQRGDFLTRTRQVAIHHVGRSGCQQNEYAEHFEMDRQSPEI